MKRFYIIGFIVVLAILLPIILWHTEDEKKLNIAIIDKTVPDETYREHLGVSWLLNHLKYKTDDGRPYEAAADYTGFVPKDKVKGYDIRTLPAQYDNYDVIYLADTYGVYEEDLPWLKKKRERAPAQPKFTAVWKKRNGIIS
ncbi:hypothetical protein [Paenibacillus sp. DMB20]|uniref:hypothetical protein n=1 Tax=Paenibacillus sp. DMB20 TaxID=1642570 RepID=UPI000A70E6A4|nr:hypothetical protein [Paenibacillus sp. DMB20]